MLGALLGSIILLIFFGAIIAALLFIFWIWMLVDCIKKDFKKDSEKIVWVLVIIFLHFLGATIYYFVVKAGDKDSKGKKK